MSQIELGTFRCTALTLVEGMKRVYQAQKSLTNTQIVPADVPVMLALTYGKLTIEGEHLTIPIQGESSVPVRDYVSAEFSLARLAKAVRMFKFDTKMVVALEMSGVSGIVIRLGPYWQCHMPVLQRVRSIKSGILLLDDRPRVENYPQEYMLRHVQGDPQEIDHHQQ